MKQFLFHAEEWPGVIPGPCKVIRKRQEGTSAEAWVSGKGSFTNFTSFYMFYERF